MFHIHSHFKYQHKLKKHNKGTKQINTDDRAHLEMAYTKEELIP